jgi:hypothetical protein
MKRIIFSIVLLLSLSACASIKNPFDKPKLVTVEASYGAVLSIAVGYRDACAKRLIPPDCRPIVKQMQAYGLRAQNAIVYARTFSKNNPTLDATNAIRVAQDAVNALKDYQSQVGVK